MVFLEPQVREDQPNINRERPVGVGFVLWVNIGLVINQLEQSSRTEIMLFYIEYCRKV